MENKNTQNNRLNSFLFRESFLVFMAKPGQTGEASVETQEPTIDAEATKKADQLFGGIGSLENKSRALDKQKVVAEKVEKNEKECTDFFRQNMNEVWEEMIKDKGERKNGNWYWLSSLHDYDIAGDFHARLSKKYDSPDARQYLLNVKPDAEFKFEIYEGGRKGGDTQTIPDFLTTRFKVQGDKPGIEFLWTEAKNPSGKKDFQFKPLTGEKTLVNLREDLKNQEPPSKGLEGIAKLDYSLDEKKNPYAKELIARLKTLPDLANVKFEKMDRANGKLKLTYSDGTNGAAKEMIFEGNEYRGLFWFEIAANIEKLYTGKNVPKALIDLAAKKGAKEAPKCEELIQKVANDSGSKPEQTLIDAAWKEFEGFRKELNLSGTRDLALLKGSVEQSKMAMQTELQKNEPQLPKSAKLNKSQFLDQQGKAEKELDEGYNITKRGVLRDQLNINPKDWDVTTANSLNKTFIQWRYLGINIDGDPFYQTMFFIFKDRLDKKSSLVESQKKLFEDPENHLNEIEKIDEEYAVAFRHFLSVRTKISKEVTDTAKIDEGQKGKGGLDKAIDTAGDVLKKNFNEFTRSIREGDYATAGVYLLGIYAMYKSYQALTAGVNGDKYKKYLFYGIAGFAGYTFAKKAGYDLLKMAGFKYKDAEIAGTSLDILTSLDLSEAKNLNSEIVLKIANVRVKDLEAMYTTADMSDDKVKTIPPDTGDLAQIFPNLRGKRGTKEYEKTGHEIFIAVATLKAAYKKTLERKTGLTFEEACKKDPILEYATVKDLCANMDLYNPGRDKPALLDWKKFERAKGTLGQAFTSTEKMSKFEITPPDDKGVMNATVLNFPVIVVYNAAHERYRFYYKDAFKGGQSGEEAFGEISENSTNSKIEANGILSKINTKMNGLSANLTKKGYSEPKFDGANWVATKDLEAQPTLGLTKETETFIVNPNHEGTELNIEMKKGDMSAIMDEGLVNKSPDSLRLLLAMLNGKNPKFKILSPFAAAKMISVDKIDSNGGTFDVTINEVKESFAIKYDVQKGEYDFADPNKEVDLLKNDAFKSKLIELSTKDPRIVDGVSRFKGLLDQTPESYVMNFVKNAPKWFTEAKSGSWFEGVKLKDLTGSVAKNYTIALLDAQMAFMKSKMIIATEGTTNFTDAAMKIENVKSTFTDKILDTVNELTRLVNKKENVTADEYNEKVFNKINVMGVTSIQYGEWYSKFVNSVMDKLGGDDLRDERAKKAGKMIGVFAYYTAPIDTLSLDGVNLSQQTPQFDEFKVKASYVNYVVDQINNRLTNDPGNIPATPESWRLLKYEEFKKNPLLNTPELLAKTKVYKTDKDYPQFDVNKKNPPDAIFRGTQMPNGMNQKQFNEWCDAAGRKTDIEVEYVRRLTVAIDSLKRENLNKYIGDTLRISEVDRKAAIMLNGGALSIKIGNDQFSIPRNKADLYNAYAAANGNVSSKVMLGLAASEANGISNKLASYGGTLTTDVQDSLINDAVRMWIETFILKDPACWTKISIPQRMKSWWDNFDFSSLFK